ncbi:hypothetical protein M422DRAFT_269656 [Sphaerobolus stellatus SS14]|uniref:F-box domain-containing protein n=1 Tax=Sphaerobolus stellatus (strain SS14) TaxID=990650 RepID=A0A0C9UUN8_SPHS4|nr:hypothetical protein M422DRAFT_269656 [Sphaerobolus stellatus SS14]
MPFYSSPINESVCDIKTISTTALESGTDIPQSTLEHGDSTYSKDTIYGERRLPAELLGEAFKFAVALNGRSSPMTVSSAPFVFTRVSRFWRYVAFSYASLWEHLIIGPPSTFHVYEVISMYLAHCSSTRPLSITAYPPLPNWHNNDIDYQILSYVSSLQSNAINVLGNLGINLPTLDTLDIVISDASYTGLSGFLRCCPMLMTLIIEVTSVDTFVTGSTLDPLNFTHLSSFELKLVSKFDPGDLICLVHAPNLLHLKISITDTQGGGDKLWFGLIYLFIISSRVETVVWKNVKFPDSLEPMLLTTTLHKLKSLKNMFIIAGSMGYLLDILSRKHSKAEWLCPALSYINFSNVAVTETELIGFLYARRSNSDSVATITTLLLRWCSGISESTLMGLDVCKEIKQCEVFEVFEVLEGETLFRPNAYINF